MMGFLHSKRGFRIKSKNEGYFGAHLVWAVQSPETPSILFMVTIRASKPSQGFSPFLEGKSIFFRKKRKPCLSPHARGFLFCVLILYGVRVFEILRFFMKTPGWVMHGFRRYKLNVLMYSYLWFFGGLFDFSWGKKRNMCGPSGDAYRKALFSKKGFFVHISSENGGALEPESENTFRLQSPSVLLRDMSAKALF